MAPMNGLMKREERRSQFEQIGFELFVKYGYKQTTMRKIAQSAEISPGLFYSYFSDKDAALSYILEKRLTALEEKLANCMKEIRSYEDFKTCLSIILNTVQYHQNLIRLFYLMPHENAPIDDVIIKWEVLLQSLINHFAAFLNEVPFPLSSFELLMKGFVLSLAIRSDSQTVDEYLIIIEQLLGGINNK
jgi:AcrR family transcriptional regulator